MSIMSNLALPPTPIVFALWASMDRNIYELEAIFSHREYAEARAEVIRKGNNSRDTEIEEVKVDDPWMMPARRVPLANFTVISGLPPGIAFIPDPECLTLGHHRANCKCDSFRVD